ncbi:MAG: hypothetical protein Q9157_004163, partial [Trypethelium eluteriae]
RGIRVATPAAAVGVGATPLVHIGIGPEDYESVGFDLGYAGGDGRQRRMKEMLEPPAPAREGFTRSPAEEVLVCPNCGDELGDGGEGTLKVQVWIVKGCGHVSGSFGYCLFAGRSKMSAVLVNDADDAGYRSTAASARTGGVVRRRKGRSRWERGRRRRERRRGLRRAWSRGAIGRYPDQSKCCNCSYDLGVHQRVSSICIARYGLVLHLWFPMIHVAGLRHGRWSEANSFDL